MKTLKTRSPASLAAGMQMHDLYSANQMHWPSVNWEPARKDARILENSLKCQNHHRMCFKGTIKALFQSREARNTQGTPNVPSWQAQRLHQMAVDLMASCPFLLLTTSLALVLPSDFQWLLLPKSPRFGCNQELGLAQRFLSKYNRKPLAGI